MAGCSTTSKPTKRARTGSGLNISQFANQTVRSYDLRRRLPSATPSSNRISTNAASHSDNIIPATRLKHRICSPVREYPSTRPLGKRKSVASTPDEGNKRPRIYRIKACIKEQGHEKASINAVQKTDEFDADSSSAALSVLEESLIAAAPNLLPSSRRWLQLSSTRRSDSWPSRMNLQDKVRTLLREGVARRTALQDVSPSTLSICSQYALRNHLAMLGDDDRVKYYVSAIRRRNANTGKNPGECRSVVAGLNVLEIGTGPLALLAITALKEGAESVDALEVNPGACSFASHFAKQIAINSVSSGPSDSVLDKETNGNTKRQNRLRIHRCYSKVFQVTRREGPDICSSVAISSSRPTDKILTRSNVLEDAEAFCSQSVGSTYRHAPVPNRSPCCSTLAQESLAALGGRDGLGFSRKSTALNKKDGESVLYDMVIHEILGDFASQEGVADVMLDLQTRMNSIPRSIPYAARTFIAPVSFPTRDCVKYPARDHLERTIFSPHQRLFQSVGMNFSSLLLTREVQALEELMFEEKLSDQMYQRRNLTFTIERSGLMAGFVAVIEVEICQGVYFGTIFEHQCDSWYTNIVLLDEEIEVRAGDKIIVHTLANLLNYQNESVCGPSFKSVVPASRPSYSLRGEVLRNKARVASFGPIVVDYKEQASCIDPKVPSAA